MEAQPQSGSSSAAYPRWVMFEQDLEINVQDSSCSPIDEAKTLASARTIAGCPIEVSLRLAEAPALSRVCLRIPDDVKQKESKVLVAHGNSVLIQLRIQVSYGEYTADHFVNNAGTPTAEPPRPPSLLLLPPYYQKPLFRYPDSDSDLVPRELGANSTGLLRYGEDGLVVAELCALSHGDDDDDDTPRVVVAYLFRSGEWELWHFEIRRDWNLPSELLHWDTVVAIDNHQLFWVDLSCGVMLLDVFKETLGVMRLPNDPHDGGSGSKRNVCATAGGGTLKFVNIFGRCCCGTAGSCDCKHSRHAYTIHTWMMRISNDDDDMEWVKDGIIDATEIWALDPYKGLPCDPLDRPVVSLDEPEVIFFRLRERDTKSDNRKLWQIMVNLRSKTIHSVSRHEEEVGYYHIRDKLIPSAVSHFFNTYPSSGTSDDDDATGQSLIDVERLPSVVVDEQPIGDGHGSNHSLLASEIFDVLQEIPSYGLGPDEVKAYRILSSDNGLRLRSLLRLSKDLRKDWLRMEIKAADAN